MRYVLFAHPSPVRTESSAGQLPQQLLTRARSILALVDGHREVNDVVLAQSESGHDALVVFFADIEAFDLLTPPHPTAQPLPTIYVVPPNPNVPERESTSVGRSLLSRVQFYDPRYWRITSVDPAEGHTWTNASLIASADHDISTAIQKCFDRFQASRTKNRKPQQSAERTAADQLRLDVEVFVHLWRQLTPELNLDPDTRRTSDALAAAAMELVSTEDPPRKVLREAFAWFAKKADIFATEFARSAGSTTGTTTGVAFTAGATFAVSGQLPRLIDAINRVLQHL